MKILIIEDEPALMDSMQSYLHMEGHICEIAGTFKEALEKIRIYNYDCTLVDLNLPDGSGFDLIKELKKQKKNTGIIIISAKHEIGNRIKSLETGADDFISKPFDLAELNARLKSLYRRINFKGDNNVTYGNILVNPNTSQVFVNSEMLELTKKEFDLFLFLISNQNIAITKETIAEHLWGDYIDAADSFDFVYSHIKNLRKKLTEKGAKDCIHNVYGVGYKFQISNDSNLESN